MTVTVTDASGNSAQRQFTLTVNAAPVAPSLAAIGDQTVELGAEITAVTPAATGTGPITYAVTGLPAGVTYDAATKTFTLDPANSAYQSLAQGAGMAIEDADAIAACLILQDYMNAHRQELSQAAGTADQQKQQ